MINFLKQAIMCLLSGISVFLIIACPFGLFGQLVLIALFLQFMAGFINEKYPNLNWVKELYRLLWWGIRYHGKRFINYIKYKL